MFKKTEPSILLSVKSIPARKLLVMDTCLPEGQNSFANSMIQ